MAPKSYFMLSYEVNGSLGKGISLAAPEIPADVSMYIFSNKSCGLKNAESLRHYHCTYAVTRQHNNCPISHVFSFTGFTGRKNIVFIVLKKRVSTSKNSLGLKSKKTIFGA
jgi:hypothetical protein